ncbi:MAG: response regulator transcription factor [Planctomycetes bacterium]|nr:response regulator transcription factor [Planctomycetota bacterium]
MTPTQAPKHRVLIVDDDESFVTFTRLALEKTGMQSLGVRSAEQALATLRREPAGSFDLILLDVNLPGASGWDFLLDIREAGSETPVIFASSRDTVADRVKGLRLGADDYLIKPVEYDELVARIEAVLRRRRGLTPIEFGDMRIDPARRKVERDGFAVPVSPREYDLLMALVRANGEVVSREQLLRDVWDITFDPETNVLDVHLGRLRKKLDRHGRPLIQTVQGKGYRAVKHLPQSGSRLSEP